MKRMSLFDRGPTRNPLMSDMHDVVELVIMPASWTSDDQAEIGKTDATSKSVIDN
jgi:hypothetical protein